MIDALNGWAVGRNGYILHTTNGGKAWVEQDNPASPGNLNAIVFPDADHGWVVGDWLSTLGGIFCYTAPPPPQGAVAGIVKLEGRSWHQGTEVRLDNEKTITGQEGGFAINEVPEGENYTLSAHKQGYLSAEKKNVMVMADQTSKFAVTLPGGDAVIDGKIDKADLDLVSQNLDQNQPGSDLNGDGVVNILDLVLTGKNAGKEGPVFWPSLGLLQFIKNAAPLLGHGEAYESAGSFSPDVVVLPDNTCRMYYTGFDGQRTRILSALSSDGNNWSREDGIRVDAFGQYDAVYSPQVIKLTSGGYRMYLSSRSKDPLLADIHSAFSNDGLSWTIESGIRIEHGGAYDSVLAQSPSLVKNSDGTLFAFPDGRFRMYYTGSDGAGFYILCACSQDGLTWQKEGLSLDLGEGGPADLNDLRLVADPEVVRLTDGTFRMFYSCNLSPLFTYPRARDLEQQAIESGVSGILSAWSEDGQHWHKEEGSRLAMGLGNTDQEMLSSITLLKIGDTWKLFYSAGDGLAAMIHGAEGLQQEAQIFSNIRIRRLNVAQVELTLNYDVSTQQRLLQLAGQSKLYLTAAVLAHGNRIPDMLVPMELLTQPQGTVTLLLEYCGKESFTSSHYELILWEKKGELIIPEEADFVYWQAFQHLMSNKFVILKQAAVQLAVSQLMIASSTDIPASLIIQAFDIGGDIFSEEFYQPTRWKPGKGGTITISKLKESPPGPNTSLIPNGPYLDALVTYSFYDIHNNTAMVEVKACDPNGQAHEQITTIPVPVSTTVDISTGFPHESKVHIPLTYTGSARNVVTTSLRAVLRTGGYIGGFSIAEEEKNHPKVWNPPATGAMGEVSAAQPTANEVNLNISYAYHPLAGLQDTASITATCYKNNQVCRELVTFPVNLAEGSGQAKTVTISYTGRQINYIADRIHLEMSLPDYVIAEKDINQTITFCPPETGRLSKASGHEPIKEPVPAGSEIEVSLDAEYNSSVATEATIFIMALKGGQVIPGIRAEEVNIERTGDPANLTQIEGEPTKVTMLLNYTGEAMRVKTDQLRARMVSKTTGRIITETLIDYNKTWNTPSTGSINSVEIHRLDAWKVQVTVRLMKRGLFRLF